MKDRWVAVFAVQGAMLFIGSVVAVVHGDWDRALILSCVGSILGLVASPESFR
jgi:hypothetical protein